MAMTAAVLPYVEWVRSTAAQREDAAIQAIAAATAYETAYALLRLRRARLIPAAPRPSPVARRRGCRQPCRGSRGLAPAMALRQRWVQGRRWHRRGFPPVSRCCRG